MKKTPKHFFMFLAILIMALSSSAQGYWELRSSKLQRLETETSDTKHFLIRDGETDVIFESKNSGFKRPDASGKYNKLPVGYEIFFRFTWMSPKHQLMPNEWITNKLGIHLTESTKNPQDANLNAASRIFFVDATTKLNSPAYQVPYTTLYKWYDIDNDAITGPSVSWNYGDRSDHTAENTVTGKVPSNPQGKISRIGLLVRLGDYGYWIYEYQWVGTSPEKVEQTTSSTSTTGNIAGIYSSDFNELTIHKNGNRISGTYKYRDGKIEGILNGNVLTGTWTQNNGKGKIRFVFAPDGSSFKGTWGYNDAEPSSKWNGEKISNLSESSDASIGGGSSIEFGTYSSDFNELTIWRNGNKVSGTYKYRDGKIEGILNGNVLTGTWTQSNGKGKIRFVFAPDGSSFEGKWGYNDAEPSSKWNGRKL